MILTAGCVSPSGLALNSGKNTSPFQAVATSTKNAFGKSRDAVAGVFGRGSSQANSVAKKEVQSDVDPLRLDRKTDVGPEVFVANGRLWESTGNRQKAMESYTKALEAAPNDPKALASIARLHQSANNYPKAIEFFQKAIQQDPDDSVLHNDLGLTLSKSGNNPAAVASLTRALEIAPGTSRYANNLASVKFDIGKSDEALKVLLDNNKPAVAHYNMAYLYQEGGQLNEAKKHLNEAVKYKNQGQTDSSIARAVNRSQQMLAKIDSSRPSALPPNTAIAKTQLPKASAKQVMVRQTSQSVAKDGSANVKTAVAKESSSPTAGPSKRVNASFATARLGSKTVAVQKPAAKPADPPKTSGAFELPPGLFGETE
ncbi:tetratricopeptide repeat protein [Planctomycetes bacterium K23_9]|uniref:Photosystem I assembly protein Ycf3 n=1 Tax=Stieleria marina TaxID=1930275 RepID=A0A517NY32_9BACT|nr:photosystem I assembly protein Ycf3 [Planctomycetes bacterium K23_9]